VRLAYADPPYPGTARKFYQKPEVDHAELIARLVRDYDGWALSTGAVNLRELLPLCPPEARVAAWVKPWTPWLYKGRMSVIYAWEPVIFKPARRLRSDVMAPIVFDWFREHAPMCSGLPGSKSETFSYWLFGLLAAAPEDTLDDLFPGTKRVSIAWEAWRAQVQIAWRPRPKAGKPAELLPEPAE
jgi:hypothetical protein